MGALRVEGRGAAAEEGKDVDMPEFDEAGDGQAELLTLVTTAATVALRSLATR